MLGRNELGAIQRAFDAMDLLHKSGIRVGRKVAFSLRAVWGVWYLGAN